MSDNTSKGGGLSFGGLLTIVFITLKLTGYIGWSWWWVLAPLWLPIAVLLGIAIVCFAIAGIIGGVSLFVKSRQAKKKPQLTRIK